MKKSIILIFIFIISGIGIENLHDSQIKKVNDGYRMQNINKINEQIDKYYILNEKYPELSEIKIEKDIHNGKSSNLCSFGFEYKTYSDETGAKNQKYLLSVCFESQGYIYKYAKNDGGIDPNRFELGNFK